VKREEQKRSLKIYKSLRRNDVASLSKEIAARRSRGAHEDAESGANTGGATSGGAAAPGLAVLPSPKHTDQAIRSFVKKQNKTLRKQTLTKANSNALAAAAAAAA
jgi:hypothetical protein